MSPEPHQPVRGRGGPADQLAVGLNVVAVTGLGYIAGFHAVYAALTGFRRPSLCAVPAALSVSAIGCYFAYQSIYAAEGGYALSRRQLNAVVAAGFGGLFTNGGPGCPQTGLRRRCRPARPARRTRASACLGGGSRGQFRELGSGTPVDLGDRVSVAPQRGGTAAAVAEAGSGVPQVETASQGLAGMPTPCGDIRPMSRPTERASAGC